MLTVADRHILAVLAEWLELRDDVERFCEPDLNDQLTAIAACGKAVARRLKGLPLLLREEVIRDGREQRLAAG